MGNADSKGCVLATFNYYRCMAITLAPVNLLGHPAFRGLKLEKHLTPAGFATNGIGQRTSLKFDRNWINPPEWQEEHSEYQPFPWSWLHEEIYEWIAVAEAVRASRDKFTMIELGAGYGRWVVAAAHLARRLKPGLPMKLVGVEAEPVHFGWMREHFIHNDLDPVEHELIEAAVDAKGGTVYFCESEDPSTDYGQHVYSEGGDPNRLSPRPVDAVGINDLIARHHHIDLIDMDIQGYERVIVPAGIGEMNRRCRRIYIGIHEPAEIGIELTEIFIRNGWTNLASFPFKSDVETCYGTISFTDGCQYWFNPRLA